MHRKNYTRLPIVTGITALLCLSVSLTAIAGSIAGKVIDRATRLSVPGAAVRLIESRRTVVTNSDGYFSFDSISSGSQTLVLRIPGFEEYSNRTETGDGERRFLVIELTERQYLMSPVTVTATRDLSLSLDVPSSVDVVTAQSIQLSNALTLSDAIAPVSGVIINDYGTFSDIRTPSIRGSSSNQVAVLLDGERLNDAQSGGVDLNTIPLSGIERIEIVRGGTSAMYGTDAVGGTINCITMSPATSSGLSVNGSVLAGSFGTRSVQSGISGGDGRYQTMLSYRYLTSRGDFPYRTPSGDEVYRSNADFLSQSVFGRGSVSFGDLPFEKTISLSTRYFYSTGGDAGTVSSRKRNQNESATLSYEQRLGAPENKLHAQAFLHNFEFTYEDPFLPNYNHNVAFGGMTDLRWKAANWSTITTGYEFRRDNFAGTSLGGNRKRDVQSIFMQDELPLPDAFAPEGIRIRFVPAVRWDHFSDFGNHLSPKIGFIARSGESWDVAVRANYGNSFRAPAFNDLYWPYETNIFSYEYGGTVYSDTIILAGNPGLRPEIGTDLDFGISFREPSFPGLSADITWFRNNFTDLIQWRERPVNYWTPDNIGRAAINGLEAGISVNPAATIRLAWSFTYLDARNRVENSPEYDDVLPFIPRQTNNLSFQGGWRNFYFNILTAFRSKTPSSDGTWLPSYHSTNLLVSYRMPVGQTQMDLKVELRNAEDARYEVMKGYPIPGREVRCTAAFGYTTSQVSP